MARIGALLGMAVMVAGCSKGSSLTEDFFDQQNATAVAVCDCFYADEGYASASECRSASTFSVPSQAISCGDRALSADTTGEVLASMQCLVDAGVIRLDCYGAASCDQMAFDTCDLDYFSDVATCPLPSPAAQADYDAALRSCIVGPGGGPEIDVCPDTDLASATGASVATGNTVTGDNDVDGSCGGYESNDAVFSWVAPSTGIVTIDTTGSDYDTVLYVIEGSSCSGMELDCDDDGGDFIDSQLMLDVTMGQEYLIVIDGWSDDEGNYVLNIGYN